MDIKPLIKKYETYISNIEWDTKFNERKGEEKERNDKQVRYYQEFLNDIAALQPSTLPLIEKEVDLKKVLKEVYAELGEELGKLANQKEFDTPNRLKGYEDAVWDLKIIIQDKANMCLSTITINDVKTQNNDTNSR